jgi:hypothetical protein
MFPAAAGAIIISIGDLTPLRSIRRLHLARRSAYRKRQAPDHSYTAVKD